jgi:tetratricopeptide (TPR) repeat protein
MRQILFFILASIVITSCSGNQEDIKVEEAKVEDKVIDTFEERTNEIDKYTAILFADSLNFNTPAAEKLLAAYEDYIEHHSFEEISKEHQFKAGELAKALNKPHVAIRHFNDLLDRDPDHSTAPMALFYKAMIVGDMLQEHETAKIYYQEFIDKYPEHPFAESAKASIELQGKSLDEIVEGFEKKNS